MTYVQSLRFAQLHFRKMRLPDSASLAQMEPDALLHIGRITEVAHDLYADERALPFWACAAALVGEMITVYERAFGGATNA